MEQLQEGAAAVEGHVSFRIPGNTFELVPLLLHRGRIHSDDIEVLQRQKLVRFRGKGLPIQVRRCGTLLSDLL